MLAENPVSTGFKISSKCESGACVGIKPMGETVMVGDMQKGEAKMTLNVSRKAFGDFVRNAKGGSLDLPKPPARR